MRAPGPGSRAGWRRRGRGSPRACAPKDSRSHPLRPAATGRGARPARGAVSSRPMQQRPRDEAPAPQRPSRPPSSPSSSPASARPTRLWPRAWPWPRRSSCVIALGGGLLDHSPDPAAGCWPRSPARPRCWPSSSSTRSCSPTGSSPSSTPTASAQAANAVGTSDATGRLGRPRVRWHPAAIAGLLAVILVASIAHVAVARYDLIAYDLGDLDRPAAATRSPSATDELALRPADRRRAGASPTRRPASRADRRTSPPRPADRRAGTARSASTSCSSASDSVADQASLQHRHDDRGQHRPGHQAGRHLSLPRDTARAAAPQLARLRLLRRRLPGQDQQPLVARPRPGRTSSPAASHRSAASTPSRAPSGELYGLDIDYYVAVDFDSFPKIVDTSAASSSTSRCRSTTTTTRSARGNAQALHPAGHPAHGRAAGARLRARAPHDLRLRPRRSASSASSPRCATRSIRPACWSRAGSRARLRPSSRAIHTDIPAELFPALVSLARQIDADARSARCVFTPPSYQVECLLRAYSLTPKREGHPPGGQGTSSPSTRRRAGTRQGRGGGRRGLRPQRHGRRPARRPASPTTSTTGHERDRAARRTAAGRPERLHADRHHRLQRRGGPEMVETIARARGRRSASRSCSDERPAGVDGRRDRHHAAAKTPRCSVRRPD